MIPPISILLRLVPWALVLLCLGCGSGTETSPGSQTASSSAPEPVAEGPLDTILVLAVDGLRAGEWPAERYPHLARLVAEGSLFSNHVVTSLGLQAQMASLLTGLPPAQHGIGSVHQEGRTFLDPALQTWCRGLFARGWRGLASFAVPQFGPRFAGFEMGFGAFGAPDPFTGDFRSLERVMLVGQDAWQELLAGDGPALAVFQSSDMQFPGEEPSAAVQSATCAALEQQLPQNPALAPVIEQARRGVEGWQAARKLVLRGRGSPLCRAFLDAVYAGQLQDLDREVGELLAGLERAGRSKRCAFVLVSLRGSAASAPEPGGPRFAPEVVRAPLVVWAPGRVKRGASTRLTGTDEVWPLLRSLLEPGNELKAPADLRVVTDGAQARVALATADLQIEENRAAGGLVYTRAGLPVVRGDALDADLRAQYERLHGALAENTPRYGWQLEFDLQPGQELRLNWRMVRGQMRGAEVLEGDVLARSNAAEGSALVKGRARLWLRTYDREPAAVLRLEGDGGLAWQPSHAPLYVLPDRGGEAEVPDASLRVMRDAGIWTRMILGNAGTTEAELEVALLPEKSGNLRRAERLESVGAPVESLAGRADASRLSATGPVNVQFQEFPGKDLAFSARVNGAELDLRRISLEGHSLWKPGTWAVYLPDWWPGLSETMAGPDGLRLAPWCTVRRLPVQVPAWRTLDDEALEWLQRVGPAE
ncbi:MAG: sulfatase-like hydrolase/transferase [Planctomycetota bacterium]